MQEEIFHSPPGIGGQGELAFIKNIPLLHGYFVIYHGTTSMLRLGDLTLIDRDKFKVVGIGEIKSHSTDKKTLQIKLIFSGPEIKREKVESEYSYSIRKPKEKNNSFELPPKAEARLLRQLSRIDKSYKKLKAPKPSEELTLKFDDYTQALSKLFKKISKKTFLYEQSTNGLLLAGIRAGEKTLTTKLLSNENSNINNKLAGIENEVKKIIINDRDDNSGSSGKCVLFPDP